MGDDLKEEEGPHDNRTINSVREIIIKEEVIHDNSNTNIIYFN